MTHHGYTRITDGNQRDTYNEYEPGTTKVHTELETLNLLLLNIK